MTASPVTSDAARSPAPASIPRSVLTLPDALALGAQGLRGRRGQALLISVGIAIGIAARLRA